MGGALYGALALLQGGQPLRVLPLQGLQLLQLVWQRLQGGQIPHLTELGGTGAWRLTGAGAVLHAVPGLPSSWHAARKRPGLPTNQLYADLEPTQHLCRMACSTAVALATSPMFHASTPPGSCRQLCNVLGTSRYPHSAL